MVPEFTPSGLLLPGVHLAAWSQFAARFIVFWRSDQRLRIGDNIRALYDEVRWSSVVWRMLVAGSFVTSKPEPNDFDCLLMDWCGLRKQSEVTREEHGRLSASDHRRPD